MRRNSAGQIQESAGDDVGVSSGVSLNDLIADWSKLWLPPKRLPLAEWAEENFYLSKYSAVHGSRIRLYGYQREPFNAFTDPRVSEIVLMTGTQLLKTILIQCAAAYAIAEAPGPILITQPDDSAAEAFSKERIAPMIQDCPALASRIRSGKSRDGSNTIGYKEFPGGLMVILGARSPDNAARRAIQYLFCDEIDKYPASAGDEGSFIELADERTATYRSRAKRIYSCSPTRKGSAISRKYAQSDQRKPHVPCPDCGEFQVLKFSQVRWDKTLPIELAPATAYYECEQPTCKARWGDLERWRAVDQTKWVASKPFAGIAGFGGLSHLYSMDKPLSTIVRKWLHAEASGDVNDLKVFVNTNLAEEWIEKGEAPDYEKLLDRREDYLGAVPASVLLITAGADVHPDRIEIEIVGWGRRRESWSLDYVILEGRPSEPEVWQKLELLLGEVFVSEIGIEMPISRLFIDSGHATNEVYTWVRAQNSARVTAIKGEHRGLLPVGPPSPVDVTVGGRKIKSGLRIKTVQVSYFKAEFYADLGKRRPTDEEIASGVPFPAGYCHFPRDGNYGDEHFKQICAEQLVTTRDRKGRERREWQQLRARNEALDCRIYARAAAWDTGIDRFKEHHWAELESRRPEELQTSAMPLSPSAEEPVSPAPPEPEQNQGALPLAPAPVRQERISIASNSRVSPAVYAAPRRRMQISLGGF